MATARKPIPTEYKGILFRSKSEAVFARAMDLSGFRQWKYEDDLCRFEDAHASYQADFLLNPVLTIDSTRFEANLHCAFAPLVIEYKPSEPTDAYRDFITSMYRQHAEQRNFASLVLFWGSPWDRDQCPYRWWTIGPEGMHKKDFVDSLTKPVRGIMCCIASFMLEAKDYRFDLKSADDVD